MASSTLEKLLAKARTLSAEEQRQLREALGKEVRSSEQAERDRRVGSIRGKYAHVLTSSADFATRKADELALEDHL